ncbi:MAG: tRNA (adenosine(37)-N6)-threonylcarbamoyltransferase complex dimerization subunit type 1 TsaB [Leptospiraceae bacterium]|nr:tRNA (adenosine(37)-N6)-threonylcarbamoyltransferase complex dimerization subunit type 1 TsaB [Leptospiraceae bacterium]
MNILYFDTSTDWIVVQIWNLSNKKIIYSFKQSSPKEASFRLTKEIKKALDVSEVSKPDFIVVSKGPGSFTGIRISVSTARNLAQLWKIPCFGLDTLEVYLDYYLTKNIYQTIFLIIDGKMKKFFFRMNDLAHQAKTEDLTIQEIQQKIESLANKELNIISNSILDIQHKTIDLNEDYPDIQGSILFKKLDFFLDKDKSKEYNYTNLLPNYMRGTYVD